MEECAGGEPGRITGSEKAEPTQRAPDTPGTTLGPGPCSDRYSFWPPKTDPDQRATGLLALLAPCERKSERAERKVRDPPNAETRWHLGKLDEGDCRIPTLPSWTRRKGVCSPVRPIPQ